MKKYMENVKKYDGICGKYVETGLERAERSTERSEERVVVYTFLLI